MTDPSFHTVHTVEILQSVKRRRGFGYWWAIFLGLALILLGLVIGVGGLWLIVLDGSWYYLLAGCGLVVSGLLLLHQRTAAVWVYLAIWLYTLTWAYWEVGFNGWALVPRLVGPTLIMPFLLLATLSLRRTTPDAMARIYAPATVAGA